MSNDVILAPRNATPSEVRQLIWDVMNAYNDDTEQYHNAAILNDELFTELKGDRPIKIKIKYV